MKNSGDVQKDSIAVVGMACVFPGAHSPEELWENVLAGRRFFRRSPKERLPRESYYAPDPTEPGKTYTDFMSVITDWSFDPIDYRIPPITYNATDLAHWLALYTAKTAIENVGLDLNSLDRSRIGCILGNSLTGEFSRSHNLRFRWPYVEKCLRKSLQPASESYVNTVVEIFRKIYDAPLPEITEDSLAGNMANTIAGRICNFFDFGGCGFTIDGACSSALLSAANACNSLINNELDIVLTGGIDISLDPFEVVGFAKTKALAQTDIRPYDEGANGMLTGEGCGIFILMKETKAGELGLKPLALIKGWGYSSDGSGGITAPEVEGQMRALKRAYERAGYPITSVALFEGHGTGTPLGDKVELSAIRRLMSLEEEPRKQPARIGSIKANIGHCKAAAGAAGLVKAIMALQDKIIPPTVNCQNPNSAFGSPLTNLIPAVQGEKWKSGDVPRRASVSAMGFGGSNSHVTLEEADPADPVREDRLKLLGSQRNSELILLSGNSSKELLEQVEILIPLSDRICFADLTDLSATLANKTNHGKYRIAIVTEFPWGLHRKLVTIKDQLSKSRVLDECNKPQEGIFAGKTLNRPKVAALFPGQGSQFINMGMHLRDSLESCRHFYREADGAVEKILNGSLTERMFKDLFAADPQEKSNWQQELSQTELTQPAIVASSMATLNCLETLGISPDICVGHSLGEISALTAAGAFSPVTAIRIAALRGRAMSKLKVSDTGSMLAVAAPASEVEKVISQCEGYAIVSNYNSPNQSVVSGESKTIDQLGDLCKERKLRCVKLSVSHAFHSEITAPAAKVFATELKDFEFSKLKKTVVSTSLGDQTDDRVNLKNLLSEHIRKPVRFTAAIEKINKKLNPDLWVEIGPGGVLSNLVRSITGNPQLDCMQTDLEGTDGFFLLHNLVAKAFTLGLPVRTEALFAERFHRPFDIYNYNPLFITNPCEREVDTEDLPTVSGSLNLPTGILPEEADSRSFQRYLRERRGYLRDLISLDYHHYTQGPSATESVDKLEFQSTRKAAEKKPEPELTGNADIMDYAIEWISKRTGFPRNSILPEMKLRDDLNLDSIKVGELVVMLCRKLNKETPADPSSFSNIQLSRLVNTVQNDFKAEIDDDASTLQSPTVSSTGAAGVAVTNVEDWVRSFRIENIPAPLKDERMLHLPHQGSVLLVGDKNSAKVEEINKRFSNKGLKTYLKNFDEAGKSLDINDIAVVLILFPEGHEFCFDQTQRTFSNQVENRALNLFHIFRNIGKNRDASWKNLRAVVISPYQKTIDFSLDAGKAFLKTCKLEHSAFQAKWLELPGDWEPATFADVVEKELQTSGSRVAYHYTPDATRLTEAAFPVPESDHDGVKLDGNDVIMFTGAARGITFELARAVAIKYGVKLILTGRSPAPEANTDANDEMLINFTRLDREGIVFKYVQFDVADLRSLKKTVRKIEKEMGKITGVVHGAGVSQLKLLLDMDKETFMKTINVKANGLYNLLHAIPVKQLKLVHVLSSVLGKTGMRGQSDYTFANAWIDGALESLRQRHPQLHCLSLGYSVWRDVGLGKKLGVVDSLRSSGVTSIGTEDGVQCYLDLCESSHPVSTFIITGQLGVELEEDLFPPCEPSHLRFTQKVVRWIPETEVVTESEISHYNDCYLPEHIFEGTTIFPAVMSIEGFVETAMLCTGCNELPSIRNAVFHRPLIIPDGNPVTVRFYAVAEKPDASGSTRVKIFLKAELDHYGEPYAEATCVFNSVEHPRKFFPELPKLKKALELDPEDFSPVPLFQGKFMRRIADVYHMKEDDSCITVLEVPENEQYFRNKSLKTVCPYPVIRDSLLQSGLLILPVGSLPSEINNLAIHLTAEPGSKVICHVKIREKLENGYRSNLAVYTEDGQLVETISDVVTLTPHGGSRDRTVHAPKPSAIESIDEELGALLPDTQQSLVFVHHGVLDSADHIPEISDAEIRDLRQKTAKARQSSVICNLIAARRAAVKFAETYGNYALSPGKVSLKHRKDGKPELDIQDSSCPENLFRDIDISLADIGTTSVAFVGHAPVGVDIETVENRNAETWLALLNDDGYVLARDMATETEETFNVTATRVWTLLEASKKANDLKRRLPRPTGSLGKAWFSFCHTTQAHIQDYLCVTLSGHDSGKTDCVLSIVTSKKNENPDEVTSDSIAEAYEELRTLTGHFKTKMQEFGKIFRNDPDANDTEKHHKQFLTEVEVLMAGLLRLEPKVNDDEKYQMRQYLVEFLMQFMEGSEVFRHALEKPYGYAGDYEMLDKLVQEDCNSTGLAYHFDRSQLEYPASQACRNRIKWVGSELVERARKKPDKKLKILSIGIGGAPIERYIVRHLPEVKFELDAVDIEPACLEFVKNTLDHPNNIVNVHRIDLRRDDAADRLRDLAVNLDVCNFIGIVEALRDEEAIRILSTLFKTITPGTPLYMESFLPDHPSRPYMEWFMDFHLGYRSKEQIMELVRKSGAKPENMQPSIDESNSLFFLKVIV